jgi:hypothetical protein
LNRFSKIAAILMATFSLIVGVIVILSRSGTAPACLTIITSDNKNGTTVARTNVVDPFTGTMLAREQLETPNNEQPYIYSPDGKRGAYMDNLTLKIGRFAVPPLRYYAPHLRDDNVYAVYDQTK